MRNKSLKFRSGTCVLNMQIGHTSKFPNCPAGIYLLKVNININTC